MRSRNLNIAIYWKCINSIHMVRDSKAPLKRYPVSHDTMLIERPFHANFNCPIDYSGLAIQTWYWLHLTAAPPQELKIRPLSRTARKESHWIMTDCARFDSLKRSARLSDPRLSQSQKYSSSYSTRDLVTGNSLLHWLLVGRLSADRLQLEQRC